MKKLTFLLFFSCIEFLYCSAGLKEITANKKRFIYSVTRDVGPTSFFIKVKYKSGNGQPSYGIISNKRLYECFSEKLGYSEREYVSVIRRILLEDTLVDICAKDSNYLSTVKDKETTFIDSLMNASSDYMRLFFDQKIVLNQEFVNWFPEVCARLWDRNIGLRTSSCHCLYALVGYFGGALVNQNIALEKEAAVVNARLAGDRKIPKRIKIDQKDLVSYIQLGNFKPGAIPIDSLSTIDRIHVEKPFHINETEIYFINKSGVFDVHFVVSGYVLQSFINALKGLHVGDEILIPTLQLYDSNGFDYYLTGLKFSITR